MTGLQRKEQLAITIDDLQKRLDELTKRVEALEYRARLSRPIGPRPKAGYPNVPGSRKLPGRAMVEAARAKFDKDKVMELQLQETKNAKAAAIPEITTNELVRQTHAEPSRWEHKRYGGGPFTNLSRRS